MDKLKKLFVVTLLSIGVHQQAFSEVLIEVNGTTKSFLENPRLNQVLDSIGLEQEWYWPSSKLFKVDSPEAEKKRVTLLDQISKIKSDSSTVNSIKTQIEGWQLANHVDINIDYDLARYHLSSNPLFEDGEYKLRVTTRPEYLTIFGAVEQPTKVKYQNNVCIKELLVNVSKAESADSNIVYAIQPNGMIREIPVAYWNHRCLQVMPGSQIYIPLKESQWFAQNSQINQLIAELAVNRIVIE